MTDSRQEASALIVGDRYRVMELLGKGGMGAVHTAEDLATGQRVALKRLFADSGHARQLFEREYRTLASLRHPRIVEVYDYGRDDEGAFYTMELLEGQDLTGAAPMPWRDVCLCLRDAASILGVLHARQLVHRDLSPRNLWRCSDGRLKLLDFGALAPFGVAKEVVGTPPLVPPEVLLRKELDGRSDLYALGALGYWLLTGAHAFRATSLGELPRLWEQEPPAPSRLLGLVGSSATDVPEPLERLIASLLRREKLERPASTVEVIDALNDVGGLAPESQALVVQGYLDSTAFVGREAEVRSYRKRLARAERGEPQTLLIEAEEGRGATRLLSELAMGAQLKGALVLRCDAAAGARPFGAASCLALSLLQRAPRCARAAAAPHASVLALLSADVRAALGDGVRPELSLHGAAEERARKQTALTAWFAAVSRERTLALCVDDVHALDEDSRALLTALAHLGAGHRVVIAATTAPQDQPSAALRALRDRGKHVVLPALSAEQTRQMLRSVFGATGHLERLAARLHGLSEGNPRHCLMLAQHLVRTEVVRYIEGTWSLPKELPEQGLPRSVRAGLVATLERLSPEARALARRLSVPDRGAISLAMCEAVHEGAVPVGALLGQLTALGVLRRTAEGFGFAHPALREALFGELADPACAQAHRRLGEVLAQDAGDDPLCNIRAGLHLIRAGDLARGEARISASCVRLMESFVDQLRDAAQLVDEALLELRAAGRGDHELLSPLTLMCWASYYCDPRYAPRYGPRAVAALEQALLMGWIRRLRPWLGARLALLVVLVVAGVRLRRTPNAPSPRETVRCLIMACTTLGGVAATALEPALARHYAAVIKPFTALGRNHMAMVAYRMLRVIALSAEERAGETLERAVRLRDWLGGGTHLVGVPPELRETLLAAAWFMYGIRSAFRDDGSAQLAADHVREFGASYEINAHQLRAMHHASRGDTAQAAHHRERMGLLAIQQGTAWRAEAFAPTVTMPFIWAHDAVSLKRAAEQLDRLTDDFPGYAHHARSARAAYHVLRGKPQLAIELLAGEPEEPLARAGWARTRSILAAAYNEVGQHAEARQVCLDALAHLGPDDLELVGLNLNLTAELAVAEAGVGEHAAGAERLERWIAKCSDRGPLLQSYLHRTRARVALLAGDGLACGEHLDISERFARETTTPSPLAAIRHLRHRQWALAGADRDSATSLLDSSVELTAVVELMLKGGAPANAHRGDRVLRVAARVAGAQQGFFVPTDPAEGVLSLGGEPPPESLLNWARERLSLSGLADQEPTAELADAAAAQDPNVLSEHGRHYVLKAFHASRHGVGLPVGALVLGFESRSAQLPAPEVLTVLSTYLTEARLPSQTFAMTGRTGVDAATLESAPPEQTQADGVDETCA